MFGRKGVGKPNQVQKLLEKVQKLKNDIMEAKRIHFKQVARWQKVVDDQELLLEIQKKMIETRDEENKHLRGVIANLNQELASCK